MFIQLTDEYLLGVQVIDEQHRQLCGWINTLHDHLSQKLSTQEITDTLNNLSDYTQEHFSFEEKTMHQAGYPEFALHIKEHRTFLVKIEELMDEYLLLDEEDLEPFANKLTAYLKEWILHHIMEEDMKIRDVLQNSAKSE
ncbi:bacteriohemerythrin [Terasakiella sp. SH-1]|uniref:bacteriohemerythrin n=1 Tax=Terasakiella sp. SH-1 TaxID=2560057 RepID=UPI00142F771B|nr:bacteriohemerythrin [Terasakiella sp. SH-1]